MTKIGIDIRMIGEEHGGIGRYVRELVPALLKSRTGIEYVLFHNREIACSPLFQKLSVPGKTRLIEVNARHYSLREQWHFYRLLEKQSLDLMHFPNFNVPLAYNKPFVVTIHDMVHHKISGAKKSRLLHFFAYKKVMGHAAKNAMKIITVSGHSKREIIRLLHVPETKVAVIYEGANLPAEITEQQVAAVRQKFYLHRPYLLFVGVLERKKNLVGLSRGFDAFIKKFKQDMDLVIAGRADAHYPEIRHKVLDIQNRDRIVLTDFVSDSDLAALYKGAYAYVSASLHEGFGLPGVEAMRFGLPLAVSNTEVFNEIYDNAAIYFDPLNPEDIAEKFQLLAGDAGFWQKISGNSFARACYFDWAKTAAETEGVYMQSLKQNSYPI